MPHTEPFLLDSDRTAHRATRLPRTHDRFDEQFIQELLVEHPGLLPVTDLRPDAGELLCIGREVPTQAGSIDNLYLSTSGYLVVVETKLWRNPQSRREVISQVLDYVKNVVTRDFVWLESVWAKFCKVRGYQSEALIEAIRKVSSDEVDEDHFIDRVHRVIERGDIIALVVGDGIETQLQQLVSHLCRDSAHLRYSLGLVSLRCYQMPARDEMLILPELVQEVEPIERAYVRIELDDALASQASISSMMQDEKDSSTGVPKKRSTLSEDELYQALSDSVGQETSDRVRRFIDELGSIGVLPDFKSAAVVLKIPDPNGEEVGASLLAIEKLGRLYNPNHGRRQVQKRWGWSQDAFERTIGTYWQKLHSIDSRFSISGMSHAGTQSFLPLKEIVEKLDAIREAVEEVVAAIQQEADRA